MAITIRQRAAAHFSRWPRYLPDGRLLGLDLSGPGIQHPSMLADVTRLVMARRKGPALDLDADELLHAVVLSILRRNRGLHPYDPRLSSVGTWVTLVTTGVICNLLEAQANRLRHEAASDPGRDAEEPAPLRPAVGHQEDTWEWEAEQRAQLAPVPLWRRAMAHRALEQAAERAERERLGQLDLSGRVAAPPPEPEAAPPRHPAVRRPVEADPRQGCLF